jgi:hypothetical protein
VARKARGIPVLRPTDAVEIDVIEDIPLDPNY